MSLSNPCSHCGHPKGAHRPGALTCPAKEQPAYRGLIRYEAPTDTVWGFLRSAPTYQASDDIRTIAQRIADLRGRRLAHA